VRCRKIREFAGEPHVQDSVAFFTQGKAYGIGVTVGGEAAAILRVTEVARRLQFLVTGTGAVLTRSRTHAGPTCSQRKTLRERPVGFESLVGHEEWTSHSILAGVRVNANCNGHFALQLPQCASPLKPPPAHAIIDVWR